MASVTFRSPHGPRPPSNPQFNGSLHDLAAALGVTYWRRLRDWTDDGVRSALTMVVGSVLW